MLNVIINGIFLEVRQVAGVLEAEILCRGEVNETETRRNVEAEASAVVLGSFLCARAAPCFPAGAAALKGRKNKV